MLKMQDIDFIEIDAAADEQLLINKFEELSERPLYPAQDERILIQLITYYGTLIKTAFNSAAKLNLVECSRYPFLDYLGRQKNCERLEDETDENYIKRILLSPEGYSCAGAEAAYIYFILSAHPSIIDAAIDVPDENASIAIDETEAEFINNTVSNNLFSAEMDFEKEEIEITLNQALSSGSIIKVKIPHPYKVIPYVLTDEGTASEEVLQAVSEKLKDVRPLTDYVKPKSAEVQTFEISGAVYLTKNADESTVHRAVNEALNSYLSALKNSLNKSVIQNQITAAVLNIDGVYDFELTSPASSLAASPQKYYDGAIGALTFERTQYN